MDYYFFLIDIMFCQDESKVTLDFVKNKLILEESRKVKCSQDEGSNDAEFTGYKNSFLQYSIPVWSFGNTSIYVST